MKRPYPFSAAALLLALTAPCLRANISISAPTLGNISVGTLVNVPIKLTNVTDLYTWKFNLSFNPAVLQLVSIHQEPLLSGNSRATVVFFPGVINNTLGTVTFTSATLVGSVPGVSNNGHAASYQFRVVGTGTSPLDLSSVVLLDPNRTGIPTNVNDGGVAATPEPSIPRWAMGIAVIGLILIQRRIAARKRAA
ncbi:MAG TPA: cohesin domain-containing protein [Bryobacteraceae bacterium]|nr:cohesin domain-containing protein [Bryobacteraceae bacterium]